MNRPIDNFMEALRLAGKVPKVTGEGWTCSCPAHGDEHASMSISVGSDGRVLVYCFTGCTPQQIVKSIGYSMKHLMPPSTIARNGTLKKSVNQKPATRQNMAKVDLCALNDSFKAAITVDQVRHLAGVLGVSAAALNDLDVGWCNAGGLKRLKAGGAGWEGREYPQGTYSFPERDGAGVIVGFTLRTVDGRKGCPARAVGSRRGLIIPKSLLERIGAGEPAAALILNVEGATDVAATLTMGVMAVGRPSCSSGGDDLAVLLKNSAVLTVGENDQKKDGAWPGRDGAISIAKGLAKQLGETFGRWAMPPEGVKDIRAWLQRQAEKGLDLRERTACEKAGADLLRSLTHQVSDCVGPSVSVGENIAITGSETHAFKVGTLIVSAPTVADNGRAVISVATADGKEVYRNKMDRDSAISRRRIAEEIAQRAGTGDIDTIDQNLLILPIPAAIEQRASLNDPKSARAARDDLTQHELEEMPEDVVDEAHRLLVEPRLMDVVLEDIGAVGVVGEQKVAAMLYLQGCSRLLRKPLSARVYGTSSSGKSYVIDAIAKLFPPEDVLRATDLTPNALYYIDFGTLINTLVVAGERAKVENDDKAEAKRALREMISAGELRKGIPIKQPDGTYRTVVIYQPGPIAYVESTTTTKIFDEDENRCIQLSTDESPEQTERIVMARVERAMRDRADDARMYLRHIALQRLLKRVEVRVPYAEAIGRAMPKKRPEARRAIDLMLGAISASAVLYQRQRAPAGLEHGAVIDASLEDYVIARRIMAAPMGRALGRALPDAVGNFGRRLEERYGRESFTSTNALKHDEVLGSKGKVNEYLSSLANAGTLECVQESKGSLPSVWRIVGNIPEPGAAWLPTVDQVEKEVRR